LADTQLSSAAATQNGGRIEFFLRPNHRLVFGKFGVARMTRKPFSTAFELDRDNIAFAVIMSAAGLIINTYADNGHPVNICAHSEFPD
jgi:hypothetical protein